MWPLALREIRKALLYETDCPTIRETNGYRANPHWMWKVKCF